MFIFSNFVRKIKFEQSLSQKVGVALAEVYLFVLPSLWVLGEQCFKTLKFSLDQYFYHSNIHFYEFFPEN